MAKNNQAYYRDIHNLDEEEISILTNAETFIYEGMLDICEAHRISKEFKSKVMPYSSPDIGNIDWMDYYAIQIAGINKSFLTRITGINDPSMRSAASFGTRITDSWDLLYLVEPFYPDQCDRFLRSDTQPPKSLWHLHLTSDLRCAMFYNGKRDWRCCTCGERAPLGVLFAVNTDKMRIAK